MPSIARCPACNAWIGAPERPDQESRSSEQREKKHEGSPTAGGVIRCPVCQSSLRVEDLPWEEIPACGVVGSQLQPAVSAIAPAPLEKVASTEPVDRRPLPPPTASPTSATGELLDGRPGGDAIWEDLEDAIDHRAAADPGIRVWIPSVPQSGTPAPTSKPSSHSGPSAAMQESLAKYSSKRSSGNLTLDFLKFRDQPNRLLEFGKILAGGVAGVALAQVILWWLPGRWQRDPLDLAPRVPRQLQFLVPENLRPMSDRHSAGQPASRSGRFDNSEGADMPAPSPDSPRPSLQAFDARGTDDPFAMSMVRDGIPLERPGDSRRVLRALRSDLQSPELVQLTRALVRTATELPRPLAQLGQDLWTRQLFATPTAGDFPADVPVLSEAKPLASLATTYLQTTHSGSIHLPAPARVALEQLARHEAHWRLLQSVLTALPPLRPIDALESVAASDGSLLAQSRPCCGLWEAPSPPNARTLPTVDSAPRSCWSLAAAMNSEVNLHLNVSLTPDRFHPMNAALVHPPVFAGIATPAFHLQDHGTITTSLPALAESH